MDLLRYVPKKFHEAVKEIWKDSDGYWINLNQGWISGTTLCRVIHTDTVRELREEAKQIEPE